ncbi:hypothetical protein PT279_02685 [Bifidobacterium sp. ESL0784]|uniref:hypothetical protein n=1 Tax=Bifidobacterium sp. ESL0784 TaxID=2983231 RepID=UPI0023F910EA|nr:hypothetical protein [Bifidobacterium sp. ESL0784]MDF7640498.1 hypothetical protein [Bifidobacterium sp. ESL0784]
MYSFNNTDDDPHGGGVIVAVCSDSQDVVLTIYDGRGRRVQSIREGKLQVIVPPQTSYTFVAKNATDRWIHANVHECDIDT